MGSKLHSWAKLFSIPKCWDSILRKPVFSPEVLGFYPEETCFQSRCIGIGKCKTQFLVGIVGGNVVQSDLPFHPWDWGFSPRFRGLSPEAMGLSPESMGLVHSRRTFKWPVPECVLKWRSGLGVKNGVIALFLHQCSQTLRLRKTSEEKAPVGLIGQGGSWDLRRLMRTQEDSSTVAKHQHTATNKNKNYK